MDTKLDKFARPSICEQFLNLISYLSSLLSLLFVLLQGGIESIQMALL
jgi:hypothetical protein